MYTHAEIGKLETGMEQGDQRGRVSHITNTNASHSCFVPCVIAPLLLFSR